MTTTISISPTRVIFSAGKFDTNKNYVRTSASGVAMAEGPTWYVVLNGSTSVNWRWSTGLDAKAYTASGSGASGTPSYVRVTT